MDLRDVHNLHLGGALRLVGSLCGSFHDGTNQKKKKEGKDGRSWSRRGKGRVTVWVE